MGRIHHVLRPARKAALRVSLRQGDVLFITAEKNAGTAPWEHAAVVSRKVRKGDAGTLNSIPVFEIPWASGGPPWSRGLMPRSTAALYSGEIQSRRLPLGHSQSPWNMGGRVLWRASAAAAALTDFRKKHFHTIFHQNAHPAHEAPSLWQNHFYTDCASVICEMYHRPVSRRKGPLLPDRIEPHTSSYTGRHPAAGISVVHPSPPPPGSTVASDYMNTLATRPSVGHLAKAIPARDRPWVPANFREAAHYALASRVYNEELRFFRTLWRRIRNFFGFL